MAEAGETHGKPDGRRGLTFPERCRIDGSHEYILAEWGGMKPLNDVKRNLRLQFSVRMQLAGLDAKLISNILKRTRLD
jgi:hypothetical protein